MSIKIDKKYVGHFMTNDYRVGDSVSVKIGCAMITAIDGDEYTLEIPNAERDEFIEECCTRCAGAGSTINYGKMYDAGARFK
jgi:riboflavin synthase alpha subunit